MDRQDVKGKIDFARQFDGVNWVEFIYKSGISRHVGLGDSYYRFAKTQAEYIENATVVDINGVRLWLSEDTDKRVWDYVERHR